MKRNQRSAHRADTPPHTASTARPNQSTDGDIACVSASVSAPDGVSRAAHRTASGTPDLQRERTKAGEDEPQQVGDGQHDLGTLRAEIVLAVANLLWFVFAGLGALTVEGQAVPEAVGWAARLTPSGALTEALTQAMSLSVDWFGLAVLAVWAGCQPCARCAGSASPDEVSWGSRYSS